MSLRVLGRVLLVAAVAALRSPLPTAASQEPAVEPLWEYRVVAVEARRCAFDDAVATTLNASGQKGWELVSYEHISFAFPKEADGTIVMRPAATGAGKNVSPQLADSFQGTVNLKLTQEQPAGCRLVFKRPFHPPAHP